MRSCQTHKHVAVDKKGGASGGSCAISGRSGRAGEAHRASIWRRSALTSGCSCPSRATPRSFSSALPSAVPASVLAVVMCVAPPADSSAACLHNRGSPLLASRLSAQATAAAPELTWCRARHARSGHSGCRQQRQQEQARWPARQCRRMVRSAALRGLCRRQPVAAAASRMPRRSRAGGAPGRHLRSRARA